MKTILTLLLCFMLSACNTLRPADPGLFTGLQVQQGVQGKAVAVYWITYDSYTELWQKCNNKSYVGCSHYGATKSSCEAMHKDPMKCKDMLEGIEYCVIMTLKHTSYALLGHETRHCFHGNFHD